MIYSTNRTASIGDITVDTNKGYFGAGSFVFAQECAQDELAMFESAIKSDIDECIIGESSYELSAITKGFIDKAKNKIKEIMKKFMEWLNAVMRSAYAKLVQLLVRDNEKFSKIAKKRIVKMPNFHNYKYSGKVLKSEATGALDDVTAFCGSKAKDAWDSVGTDYEKAKAELEAVKKEFEENTHDFNVSATMDDLTETVSDAGRDIVYKHIEMLEKLAKSTKKLKTTLDTFRKNAATISKEADRDLGKLKSDTDEESKKAANAKAEAAGVFKTLAQSATKYCLSLTKAMAKVARAVVAKAMGASPKNEGFYGDTELTDMIIEAVDYEYDEALEEMSEASDHTDDDFDDLEDTDED